MTKEINLQREVTQEFGKNAAQTTAAVSDKLGNTQSYERYQAAKTLLEAKLQNTDSETEKAAVRATLGQVNAYLAENQSRYDTWKEGGIGRSILHGAAGGLTTGSLGGILAGGGTSLAAPYLDKAAENLGPAGKATVNALGGAAIGYAAGGNVGTAAVGANVDWNNRQLHDSEIKKIKDNAAKFAKLHPGISQRQAEERLVAQAMRQVDAAYYTKHADTDTAAEQFLRSIAGSFKTDGETFLDFAPMKYYRDSGKFAEQQGYRETREQLKRNAVSSYTQRSRQIRNKTFDTATTGLGKGIANLPSFYANGFIGTYNGVIGKLVGKEAPYVPLIKDYNNPIEEEVGAWAADKFDRAAGMITGIRIGAVSSGRGTWNKNGKTGAGQKTGEMSVLDREMAGGNKSIKPPPKMNSPILEKIFEKSIPTKGHPNQFMYTLSDGTRVIFRKDFGQNSHPIGNIFQGKGAIDHYNIEIQIPKANGSVKTIENLHIVPNSSGGFTWWGKDGVTKK